MTDIVQTRKQGLTTHLGRIPQWVWVMGLAAVIYAIAARAILSTMNTTNLRFRFDLTPLLEAPGIIQIHVAGALLAFVIGMVLLFAPKGFRLHKALGWSWVIAMIITAISSFYITGMNGSDLSIIHGLSAWVLIGLPFGIMAIRRRDVKRHRRMMTGMYLAGMGVAGLLSFLPSRLMFSLIAGS